MGKLRVIAKVRRVGAIGIFYPLTFILENAPEEYKDDWFAQYGQHWELEHFCKVEQINEVQTEGADSQG